MQPDPLDGSPFGMPQVFDCGQYRAEVQRASRERAWEAESWQAALLLDKYLRGESRAPGGTWNLGKAERHAEDTGTFTVTVWDDYREHGLIVDLAADPGTPEQRARQMADFLITTPQDQWPRARPTQQGTSRLACPLRARSSGKTPGLAVNHGTLAQPRDLRRARLKRLHAKPSKLVMMVRFTSAVQPESPGQRQTTQSKIRWP